MIKPDPKNGTGSKLEPVLRIRYSEMAIPTIAPQKFYFAPQINLTPEP